jgi:hypothetical protein
MRQISISWLGFETTITAFDRATTSHDLDRAATVIGMWSSWWNQNRQEKPKVLGKKHAPYPSATTCTTNSMWHYLGSNPDRRGGNPATNSLNYGSAPTAVRICGNKERNSKAETSSLPMTSYKNQSISVYNTESSWICLPWYFFLIFRYFSYGSVGLIVWFCPHCSGALATLRSASIRTSTFMKQLKESLFQLKRDTEGCY